jgi:hypothetical protein
LFFAAKKGRVCWLAVDKLATWQMEGAGEYGVDFWIPDQCVRESNEMDASRPKTTVVVVGTVYRVVGKTQLKAAADMKEPIAVRGVWQGMRVRSGVGT